MWGSAELSAAHLRGDLLAALAGLLYAGYLICGRRTRRTLAPMPLLFLASLFGAAMLLPAALVSGETFAPADWTALFALALCSQVIGQGLLGLCARPGAAAGGRDCDAHPAGAVGFSRLAVLWRKPDRRSTGSGRC